jgi:hypothetical protein
MNSRERVMAAVNHRAPDRTPIDLGGMKGSGIAALAYARLKSALGLPGPVRVSDVRSMTAEVEEPVRRRFGIDVVPLDWSTVFDAGLPSAAWVPWRLPDGTGVLLPPGTRIGARDDGGWDLLGTDGMPSGFRMPRGGFYFDDLTFGADGDIDPRAFRPVADIPDDDLARFAHRAAALRDAGDEALLGWGFGVSFLGLSLVVDKSTSVAQGKPASWAMMLLTEPETCREMMGRAVDASIRCLSLVHQAVGDIPVAWGIAADDSGTQRGEYVRPELWAEVVKPQYARLCAWVHANTGWKTFLHSCGSVQGLIAHFVEAGIDILNPVQTSAANMEPDGLVRDFGGKIVFWGGGCDTQSVLGRASPAEVREHVRGRLETFRGRSGGFVFNQVHNIQANVPAENVIAMLDAAREFG